MLVVALLVMFIFLTGLGWFHMTRDRRPRKTVHLVTSSLGLCDLCLADVTDDAVCRVERTWETVYRNNDRYRRCCDPVDLIPNLKLRPGPCPTEPGFY